ncbi:MAG: coiled-coil domain-containing protein, partial [Candidatus Caldatribacteriaceae bacterium]
MRVKGYWFLFLVFFLVFVFVAWGKDLVQEIASQEKKLEELKKEQSRVEQELNKALKNEKNILAEIEKLEVQIERLESDISRSRQRILALEKERTSLQKEVEMLTEDINQNKSRMKALLVEVYRRNFGISFWEHLVESASPSEWEEK